VRGLWGGRGTGGGNVGRSGKGWRDYGMEEKG